MSVTFGGFPLKIEMSEAMSRRGREGDVRAGLGSGGGFGGRSCLGWPFLREEGKLV